MTTLVAAANVFESLSSFFDSPIWSFIKYMLVIFLVLMWLALVVWVFKDARRRNTAPGYPRLMAAIALLIPYFGPLLYIAVRPSETVDEQSDRELETLALQREAALRCGDCGFPTEPGYLICPACHRKLKEPCHTCARPVDPRWSACPWCEASLGNPALHAGFGQDTARQDAIPSNTPTPVEEHN